MGLFFLNQNSRHAELDSPSVIIVPASLANQNQVQGDGEVHDGRVHGDGSIPIFLQSRET